MLIIIYEGIAFHRYTFFVFFFACVCSYCENGSMRCSSPEMSTLLSDLFYDDDLAPSRGTISVFYRSSIKCRYDSVSYNPLSLWYLSFEHLYLMLDFAALECSEQLHQYVSVFRNWSPTSCYSTTHWCLLLCLQSAGQPSALLH